MGRTIIIAILAVMLLGLVSTDSNAGMMLRPDDAGIAKMYSYFFNYNWLRDDDGDGIPNCLDPDYVKPEDGTGYGKVTGAGDCTGDCDGTPDRIRDRTKLQLKDKDCTKLQTLR